jgi:hypothetical protein
MRSVGNRELPHTRCTYEERFVTKRDIDQSHPMRFALRDEHAVRIDQHPAPVMLKAALIQLRILEGDAASGFYRIDEKLTYVHRVLSKLIHSVHVHVNVNVNVDVR